MDVDEFAGSPRVPLHAKQGAAPGGTAAFSNQDDTHFTAVENYSDDGVIFLGYQWQCVEYARRWLLERKGLLLPQVYFAAHIIFLDTVYDLDLRPVATVIVRNGTTTRPVPDSLIVYPQSRENFVGHVGVITEVGEDYVCVADQNRFFHHWGERTHSMRFKLDKTPDGKYFIRDHEVECAGWLTFPGHPNLEAKPEVPRSLKGTPALSTWTNLKLFGRGLQDFESKWVFLATFVPMATWFLVRQGLRVTGRLAKNLLGWR
jgi:trypanothione synthetase/amidase